MREIKFRAKAGTQWRYGDLYHNERGELMIYEPLTKGKTLDGAAVHGWRLVVDPKTVGQFTGLTDEDGREIYEGDIVRNETTDETGVVFYVSAQFVVKGENDRLSLYLFVYSDYGCRVIGNVHDSPDLLEDSNGRL